MPLGGFDASYYALVSAFFFFNDTPTTEIYTLSLPDALPIWPSRARSPRRCSRPARRTARRRRRTRGGGSRRRRAVRRAGQDRQSTRLNSSHAHISYAVFCL